MGAIGRKTYPWKMDLVMVGDVETKNQNPPRLV